MNKLRDDWEKKRKKLWEQQLGYDEDACEQIPEEDSPICTKASPASRGEYRPYSTHCVPAKQKGIEDEEWPSS